MKYDLKLQMGWMAVAAFWIVGIILFSVVGKMDAEDQQIQADHYSEMVCQGHWPDYRDIKPDCER